MIEDSMRQLIELNYQAAKKRLNPQTGLIHLNYHALPGEEAYTIPLLENMCYALTLLRTKIAENVVEAKSLLEKLLYFQSPASHEDQGNFPMYLHEYPKCYDQYQAIHLLPVFYWIVKLFGPVLGNLKQRLLEVSKDLINFSQNLNREQPLSYLSLVKLTAACQAFREMIEIAPMEKPLNFYAEEDQEWYSTKAFKEILISLQMIYPEISKSPWTRFWSAFKNTWHLHLKCYAGPAFKEYQKGLEPLASLYDLYGGYFSKGFSNFTLKEDSCHLQAALIMPSQDRFEGVNPQPINTLPPFLTTETYALNAINLPSQHYEKGFHFFRLLWGSSLRNHSLVCQGGNIVSCEPLLEQNKTALILTLGEKVDFDDRDKSREVSFFWDIAPETQILVEGQPATTFSLDQEVEIRVENFSIKISFKILEGEGRFLGHIMRQNRLAQVLNKGINRYEAYDWILFLRTLDRSEKCRIAAYFSFGS